MPVTDTHLADTEAQTDDLGPLAWVLDELKKSLDSATKAMRRFVRDADLARGSDLASLDASHLRIARQQLHQAVGALEMVGFSAPAKVMRAMEALAQKFVQHPEQCSDEAANKMERASFALAEYLEGMLKGKAGSPVALFSQYKEVIELVEGERVHPADLWDHDLRWVDVPIPMSVPVLTYSPPVRTVLDQSVLRVVKLADTVSAKRLRDLSLGLAAGHDRLAARCFWHITAAFFEANATGLCATDVFAKRAGSRVLQQYATLAKGEDSVSERLAQDLLFFCAQSNPANESEAPILWAVRKAFGLSQSIAVNYEVAQYGRFDPAMLALVRKRIASATETWSALAGGDTNRLKMAQEQFSAVAETMLKLHPENSELARALVRAVDASVRSGEPPSTPVAMEVATAVLYLEATYDDLEPADSTMATRSQRLSKRLDQVSNGGPSEPLESWMEDLYRRVSDRQTMGSVVDELRMNLGEVEKSLDQFFRNPADKVPLHQVPSQLAQMRGVFSVLGLDQASLAMLRLRDSVEKMLIEGAQPGSPSFEKLGSSLGAVGFLIDMLSYQRAMAKKVFAWDEDIGEFKPLMGRQSKPPRVAADVSLQTTPSTSVSNAQTPAATAPIVPIAATNEGSAALTSVGLGALNLPSLDLTPPPSIPQVTQPVVASPVFKAEPVAQPSQTLGATEPDEDAEIREIFLEEANEVIQNGKLAIQALSSDPANLADQTTLRRAFHTLKGSSRMVGLNDFGEAAWSMEQLMNAWLAEQKPASPDLLSLVTKAVDGFGIWIALIANRKDAGWGPKGFRTSADAMRLENRLLSLELPDAPRSAPFINEPAAPIVVPEPSTSGEIVVTDALVADTEIVAPVVVDFEATAVFDFQTSKVRSPSSQFDPGQGLGLGDIDFTASRTLTVSAPAADGGNQSEINVASAAVQEIPSAFLSDEATFTAPAKSLIEQEFDAENSDTSDGSLESSKVDTRAENSLVGETESEARLPFLATDGGSTASDSMEDSVKVIGDLKIGIPLYNVYLNEADEWSRRLQMDLSEWAIELYKPLPDSAIAFAHSLSGSSSTVGFTALADIARTLESAMQHVQFHGKGQTDHAQAFSNAAEEIRRLLHQFAAGFLKTPSVEITEVLAAIANQEFAVAAGSDLDSLSFSDSRPASGEGGEPFANDNQQSASQPPTVDLPATVSFDESQGPETQILESRFPSQTLDKGLGYSLESTALPLSALAATALVGASSIASFPPEKHDQVAPSEGLAMVEASAMLPAATLKVVSSSRRIEVQDDDTDLVDALDADLFPIFEEEAQDLLPQLGGALRQWTARPDNLSARGEALRVLHTLKGSARLAGALRLGEKTHRMETSIEQLGVENITTSQLEPLLAGFDDIRANFENLRNATGDSIVNPEGVLPASVDGISQYLLGDAAPIAASSMNAPSAMSDPLKQAATRVIAPERQINTQSLRVRAQVMDSLVNQAGEVMIARSRIEARLAQLKSSMKDLTGNLERMRHHLRDIEVQAETQMQSRMALAKETSQVFDPLEFDQFTRLQELTRMMAESVNDVATVQRNMQQAVEGSEDDLIAQGRQARELQRDLLRTRMVEFESISERLYGVVRQAAKETGKQVKLDITGGSMDLDRSVLERMAPAFEHLLRNSVAHGIEPGDVRTQSGKNTAGSITIDLQHTSNELSVTFADDGAGLDLPRIRAKAVSSGVAANANELSEDEVANLIFLPGFSTATAVSEMAGRGIGMDVVRTEMNALGGRIETRSVAGKGTQFQLVLPLTTAVTQVVMFRMGDLSVGVPANMVEIVRRVPLAGLQTAYQQGTFDHAGVQIPFYWGGALLQASVGSAEMVSKHLPVAVFRSAGLHVALHIDEVLGNQEVVVKNLGPQLSRLPGLTGMSVLASGVAVLIYNPVALVSVYGEAAKVMSRHGHSATYASNTGTVATSARTALPTGSTIPLIMVVDDSITVRRVTQRLLKREGYRVVLAADGLQALERLQDERPAVVLSDIEMPRMDGFDLARNIRADAALKDLPIIMITSRIAEKHREHARELGVDHYLGKPYSEEELLRLVHQYCRAQEAAVYQH